MRIRTHLFSMLAMALIVGLPMRAGDPVIALRAARMWDGIGTIEYSNIPYYPSLVY